MELYLEDVLLGSRRRPWFHKDRAVILFFCTWTFTSVIHLLNNFLFGSNWTNSDVDHDTGNQCKTLTVNIQGVWMREAWRHQPPSHGDVIYRQRVKKKNHLHCRPMFFYRKASVHLTAVLLNMLTFHWNHVHGGSKTVKQDTNVDRRVKQKKNLSGNPASSVSSPLTGLHGLQNPVLASLASSPPSSSPCLTCFCRQNWIHCNARKSSGRL